MHWGPVDSALRFQLPNVDKAKADPGQAHWARVPPFEIFFLSVFVNFDCMICVYFNRSQHTMFTICNLFSTLATMWRDIKTIQQPEEFYRALVAPLVFKFRDPPLQRSLSDWHTARYLTTDILGLSFHR